ncbi:MAG: hypothetical protein A2268_02270 [Candidatus Raymondbacteria bacterium RifOxyA12_full_50_37]|uniref:Uncharacterized protein n=1 Tax=Candidatus Raymondbacteria bacterium RIFOXYD12_FULL_49_13 TaxID=1817890 RepID=A0A1F7F5R7_UNCRA|nr:MAG: hypothetical protein A2350_07795 [Candidatus Raymondbacteria bacterium RifOxyB12_full_50_8]OGJ91280.1 MAG: hypothetical protein A2268_02270 [Candidatus Raymondbacteria bacterium RifOxyA12_full_50_37]OGJ92250.1 MAG: hypothetical protein A2248_11100 [Candidatus Raymondbacteria bacterium RIFOXYA2_FULL_49_16]OGJ98576.1 MAG: hypothetical protein A2453_06900 [Candidatus Raymondbacteria bacterium RIFOXYC2_FULL_50_21]OGK01877.1 MAG: hypothetical protein A2519_04795 [Candidatus Raymondbacteria b
MELTPRTNTAQGHPPDRGAILRLLFRGFNNSRTVTYTLHQDNATYYCVGVAPNGKVVKELVFHSKNNTIKLPQGFDPDGERFTLSYSGNTLLVRMLEIPAAEDVSEWLIKNPESFLPHSINPDQVYYDYIVQPSDNAINSVIVVVVKMDNLDADVAAFAKAGISFLRITSGPLEFIRARDPELLQGIYGVLLVEQCQTFLFVLVNGEVKICRRIALGEKAAAENPEAFAAETDSVLVQYWETHLFGVPVEHWLVFGNCPGFIDHCRKEQRHVASLPVNTSTSHEIAYHAAQTTIGKSGNRIRLGPAASADNVRRIRFKKIFTIGKTIGLAACAGLVLLFALFRLGIFIGELSGRSAYAEYSGTIEQLNKVKQENRRLSRDLKEDQGLSAHRSRVFLLLESARNCLPDSVWFSSMHFQKGVETGPEMYVTGFASREEGLKDFLVKLEQNKQFGKVTLNVTKNVAGSKAYGTTKGRFRSEAVYFKITMAL